MCIRDSPNIDQIALVVNKDSLAEGRNVIKEYSLTNVTAICVGGTKRRYSVRAGLNAINPCDTVIIHDAARPIIDLTMIERGLLAAEDTGAAIAAVPTTDTHKIVSSENMVIDTIDRKTLWAVQTPQIFDYHLLVSVHEQANGDFTDDASMVESLGYPVKIIMGSYKNIKVEMHNVIKMLVQVMNNLNENSSSFEKLPDISGFTLATSPLIILPVDPSIVIMSPSLISNEEVLKIFLS